MIPESIKQIKLSKFEDIHLYFHTEDDARKYLSWVRWGEWAKCPFCNNDKAYFIENGSRYKCANKNCYKKFSVTTRTLIEASNIPLKKIIIIIYKYISLKGRILSEEIGSECGIKRLSAFILKDKLDFAFKRIDRIGKTSQQIFNETLNQIFSLYEHYEQFKQVRYTKSFHITDSEINDIGDQKQYDRLLFYIRYYINVYCHWIFLDFATPQDILSETFLRLKENGIKEYNGSFMISYIQKTVNILWYNFLKSHPKFYNKERHWSNKSKQEARINLKKWYIVELILKSKDNKLSRSEINNNLDLINNKRKEIIERRRKYHNNYDFISHFS